MLIKQDVYAGSLVERDSTRDVFRPFWVEIADSLSCRLIVEGFLVATVFETILLQVADKALLQTLVHLGLLEEHIEDSLKITRGHVAVLQA